MIETLKRPLRSVPPPAWLSSAAHGEKYEEKVSEKDGKRFAKREYFEYLR